MSEPLTDSELMALDKMFADLKGFPNPAAEIRELREIGLENTRLRKLVIAENAKLRDEVEGLRGQCREYGQVNTQFAEEKTKLREYIRHETTCPKDYCVSPDGAICTCGLDAALKRAENA